MGKINANKKLELVKAIRMQNQYNRQLFRSREHFLYSDTPQARFGEIYGLEDVKPAAEEKSAPVAGGFRIRLAIALALFVLFVLCDINHISYEGETTGTVFERMTNSPDLTEFFEFLKSDI